MTMRENVGLNGVNAMAIPMKQYTDFRGTSALAGEDATPRTPLGELEQSWRSLADSVDDGSRVTTCSNAAQILRRCADELGEALRAATPQPRSERLDEVREMQKRLWELRNNYAANKAQNVVRRLTRIDKDWLQPRIAELEAAHPQGED